MYDAAKGPAGELDCTLGSLRTNLLPKTYLPTCTSRATDENSICWEAMKEPIAEGPYNPAKSIICRARIKSNSCPLGKTEMPTPPPTQLGMDAYDGGCTDDS